MRILKRLIAALLFLPIALAWLLFGWIEWVVTGHSSPWTEYILNWAKYDDFTDIPF